MSLLVLNELCLCWTGERRHSGAAGEGGSALWLPRLLLWYLCKNFKAFVCRNIRFIIKRASKQPLSCIFQVLAVFRFAALILAYAICKLRHWWAIAVSSRLRLSAWRHTLSWSTPNEGKTNTLLQTYPVGVYPQTWWVKSRRTPFYIREKGKRHVDTWASIGWWGAIFQNTSRTWLPSWQPPYWIKIEGCPVFFLTHPVALLLNRMFKFFVLSIIKLWLYSNVHQTHPDQRCCIY